jgi:hypothetical protein
MGADGQEVGNYNSFYLITIDLAITITFSVCSINFLIEKRECKGVDLAATAMATTPKRRTIYVLRCI